MDKSVLLHLIRSFTPVELREVKKFLLSPFFNQRDDLTAMFEYLAGNGDPEKQSVWRRLHGSAPYNDQKMRLLMSYLHNLLERYIEIKELTADPLNARLHLAKGYRKRRMNESFERVRSSLEKSLARQALRNMYFHDMQYKLEWEAHQLNYIQNPTDVSRLRNLSETSEVIYLSQKLRLICLLTAHHSIYHSGADASREEELIERAEQSNLNALPAIAAYLHCYRMLKFPEEEVHFQKFKALLLEHAGKFSDEEMHGLFILAINYCVRRLNSGGDRYFREAFDLYREGLEKGFLYEEGMLSRFTYHNVVAIGLRLGELDWVRTFIYDNKNRLEKRYRESAFSYNLARLEYKSGNSGSVLELLQKANYRDPLLNLAAKTLLFKTYYNLQEYDLLQSHLDAMRNYIHRKRVIGYHRNNYLNIVRYGEKLMRLNMHDRAAVKALADDIEREDVLTEKEYFQQVLFDVLPGTKDG